MFCFCVVSKYRPARRAQTSAEQRNARSFERWSDAMAGKGKTARLEHPHPSSSESSNAHSHYPPNASLSTEFLPPYCPRRPPSFSGLSSLSATTTAFDADRNEDAVHDPHAQPVPKPMDAEPPTPDSAMSISPPAAVYLSHGRAAASIVDAADVTFSTGRYAL